MNIPFEERIARIAHETNRAYCQAIGDDTQAAWPDAPQWQRESAINGVQFHLKELRAGRLPSPEESHNGWLAQKRAEGWTYGPKKDPSLKQHPCFMPYDGLPLDQRLKDYLFGAVCRAFFEATKNEAGFQPAVTADGVPV